MATFLQSVFTVTTLDPDLEDNIADTKRKSGITLYPAIFIFECIQNILPSRSLRLVIRGNNYLNKA
jgi:hypothetical protein